MEVDELIKQVKSAVETEMTTRGAKFADVDALDNLKKELQTLSERKAATFEEDAQSLLVDFATRAGASKIDFEQFFKSINEMSEDFSARKAKEAEQTEEIPLEEAVARCAKEVQGTDAYRLFVSGETNRLSMRAAATMTLTTVKDVLDRELKEGIITEPRRRGWLDLFNALRVADTDATHITIAERRKKEGDVIGLSELMVKPKLDLMYVPKRYSYIMIGGHSSFTNRALNDFPQILRDAIDELKFSGYQKLAEYMFTGFTDAEGNHFVGLDEVGVPYVANGFIAESDNPRLPDVIAAGLSSGESLGLNYDIVVISRQKFLSWQTARNAYGVLLSEDLARMGVRVIGDNQITDDSIYFIDSTFFRTRMRRAHTTLADTSHEGEFDIILSRASQAAQTDAVTNSFNVVVEFGAYSYDRFTGLGVMADTISNIKTLITPPAVEA